jgi:hypothetical protein
MNKTNKSNINLKYDKFFNLSLASICLIFVTSCVGMTETNYASSVEGYEERVSAVNYAQAKEIKSNSERFARVGAPPVIINNPLAISESIGSGLAVNSGAFANGVFMPSQSAGGSAYGSLNSGVIQQGVFMPSSGTTVNPANNFGNNFLSPARR